MNMKRIFALAFAVLMVLALAACGAKDNDKQADMSGESSAMTGEPKTAEEALALHKELLERENALLSENAELWEKVFMAADKGMTMQEDGKNYGDFLLDTVEAAKEQFTDKEYAWLKESATEISNIENKLTELEEKYPEIMQKSMDGDMSMPAGSDTSTPPDDGSMQKFPAFEGKDLDGNTVKSDELFSGNTVTVVNFWFTTCNPCVGELAELDALNKELAEKGGSLIGVNTFTLDGDEAAISEAKDVLAKKGATYQNVYFDSDGEAGKFTSNIFAYPTTYVVDRNGNIVGEPIVGAITEKNQAEALQKLIDQALAAADVLLAGSAYTEQDVNDVTKLVSDAIAGLAPKEVSSLTVTPSKTTYQVGDVIDADHDLKVVGNYSAGMGNVTLSADQFTLDYDFSAPADAAKVTVTLKSNPNVTETYTVAVTSRAEGGSGNGSDGAGNGGATINPDTGEGDKTNGANGNKITGVLSNTGSAVTAVGLAVVVLGVAGGVSLALRRKRS